VTFQGKYYSKEDILSIREKLNLENKE